MADQRSEPPNRPADEIFHIEQASAVREFWTRVKEAIHPPKPPELVLESKPIPVKDIWSPPQSISSRLKSFGVHVAVIVIILLPFWKPVRAKVEKLTVQTIFVPSSIHVATPPPIRLVRLSGGGAPVLNAPKKISTPHPNPMNISPTLLAPVVAQAMPSFGSIGPISGPPGAGGGVNGGSGGMGRGSAGGTCTGPNCVDAGTVAATDPIPIFKPDPEYTDAARKARFQGTCVVQVVIGSNGMVSDPRVVQALGLGLDQKAVEAVLKWRFEPARDKHGKPIAVLATIDINFHLY
ncbi:MAG: energy transducer TonB [Terriglobales bacterium]